MSSKTLPIQFKYTNNGDTLVVTFHGMLSQQSRPYPHFEAWGLSNLIEASVLAIADPCLTADKSLEASWYIGTHEYNLQKELTNWLVDFINTNGH